ncbi:MAG TPA: hypothetical protein VH107_19600, partial [Lacipirellulaceae bacterium]|nr:hypothetical protein [Lacipirellulaceae bacterium]
MLGLLNSFIAGSVSVEHLRGEFDRRTRTDWRWFGFKGLSGAMFLNMLVKHIRSEIALTEQLKTALAVPPDESTATERLGDLIGYLEGEIAVGNATKAQLQPARAPFFVSAWWHLQQPEDWPVYYPTGRKTLQIEGEYEAKDKAADDYFAFRRAFLELAAVLNVSSWEFEHLLDWCNNRESQKRTAVIEVHSATGVENDDIQPNDDKTEEATHTKSQWLLARIGQKLGCKVWIAANDRKKIWNGETLGELSLSELPNL